MEVSIGVMPVVLLEGSIYGSVAEWKRNEKEDLHRMERASGRSSPMFEDDWGLGVIFGPQDPEFGPPDVPAGPGTFFGQKWGLEKDGFVEEMVPQWTVWQTKRGK